MKRASTSVARHVFEYQKACASSAAAAAVNRPEAPSKWARPTMSHSSFQQPQSQNYRRTADGFGSSSYDRPNFPRRDSFNASQGGSNNSQGSMNRNGNRGPNSNSNFSRQGFSDRTGGQNVTRREWVPPSGRSTEASSSRPQKQDQFVRSGSPQRRNDRSPNSEKRDQRSNAPKGDSSSRTGRQPVESRAQSVSAVDPTPVVDVDDLDTYAGAERWRSKKQKKGASALARLQQELEAEEAAGGAASQQKKKLSNGKKAVKEIKVVPDVYIPRMISVGNLARLLGAKREVVEDVMAHGGLGLADYDRVIPADEASLIAMELGRNPIINDEAAFDIYAEPTPTDLSAVPARPPVVTIMGHVDHGKTTLLDTLRSASVAASESGGITQHIGAFSVPLKSLSTSSQSSMSQNSANSITFLDTPGHAAFSAMRARGANVTDIIVLVVAADDGVMPQSREVIELAKRDSKVQLVVAINKCDKPGVNVEKIKHGLLAEGVQLEDFGGDVPSVEVSGLTGLGLDNLMETISTMAEISDLRAEKTLRPHGHVLEARMEKGQGPVATVLVSRGTLKVGDHIVAGTTWAKVRSLSDDKGKSTKLAYPGTPVTVSGWKELPTAGDEVLGEPKNSLDKIKKAVENRKREKDALAMAEDVQTINERRRADKERRETFLANVSGSLSYKKKIALGPDTPSAYQHQDDGIKELRIIVKTDVSGTTEAVVGAISGIGNKEARVAVVQSGVGDVTDSDIKMASAVQGMILGFNVNIPRAMESLASQSNVPVHIDTVIYRLIDEIRGRVSALLPPTIEHRVLGEAKVQELFKIALKGGKSLSVAGCRITNGSMEKNKNVRVVRNGEIIASGPCTGLKHHRDEVNEVRKGMECGLTMEEFCDFKEGDLIQSFSTIEVPRTL